MPVHGEPRATAATSHGPTAAETASSIEDVAQIRHAPGVEEACRVFAAMLALEVAPRELATFLAAWRGRRAALAETTGFMRALDAHVGRLEMPRDRPRPVLLPAYHGARRQSNLTALVALLLQRYGGSVLVHGHSGADATPSAGDEAAANGIDIGGVTTADVLWELGIEPAASLADAQARLVHDRIAYVPAAVLAPGLVRLLAPPAPLSRWTPGFALAKLIDPFGGDGFRVVGVSPSDDSAAMREFLIASRGDALFFPGAEGEPFADPRDPPQLEHVAAGVATPCADAETGAGAGETALPEALDAPGIAAWIARVLAGSEAVPAPIIAQLACCLNGARRP